MRLPVRHVALAVALLFPAFTGADPPVARDVPVQEKDVADFLGHRQFADPSS